MCIAVALRCCCDCARLAVSALPAARWVEQKESSVGEAAPSKRASQPAITDGIGTPRPQPQRFSKLVFRTYFS